MAMLKSVSALCLLIAHGASYADTSWYVQDSITRECIIADFKRLGIDQSAISSKMEDGDDITVAVETQIGTYVFYNNQESCLEAFNVERVNRWKFEEEVKLNRGY